MDHPKTTANQRCKYVKMPVKTKIAFFKKVLQEHMSIKDSAAMFSINYSTAKTLMRQYKFNTLPFDVTQQQPPLPYTTAKKPHLVCGYKDISDISTVNQCKKEEDSLQYHSFQLKNGFSLRKEVDEMVKKEEHNLQFPDQQFKIEIISSIVFN